MSYYGRGVYVCVGHTMTEVCMGHTMAEVCMGSHTMAEVYVCGSYHDRGVYVGVILWQRCVYIFMCV